MEGKLAVHASEHDGQPLAFTGDGTVEIEKPFIGTVTECVLRKSAHIDLVESDNDVGFRILGHGIDSDPCGQLSAIKVSRYGTEADKTVSSLGDSLDILQPDAVDANRFGRGLDIQIKFAKQRGINDADILICSVLFGVIGLGLMIRRQVTVKINGTKGETGEIFTAAVSILHPSSA